MLEDKENECTEIEEILLERIENVQKRFVWYYNDHLTKSTLIVQVVIFARV